MKKEKIQLEQLDIPDILQEDILEVITNVKELLRNQPVKKHESSTFRILRELLHIHGWKSILIQAALDRKSVV